MTDCRLQGSMADRVQGPRRSTYQCLEVSGGEIWLEKTADCRYPLVFKTKGVAMSYTLIPLYKVMDERSSVHLKQQRNDVDRAVVATDSPAGIFRPRFKECSLQPENSSIRRPFLTKSLRMPLCAICLDYVCVRENDGTAGRLHLEGAPKGPSGQWWRPQSA